MNVGNVLKVIFLCVAFALLFACYEDANSSCTLDSKDTCTDSVSISETKYTPGLALEINDKVNATIYACGIDRDSAYQIVNKFIENGTINVDKLNSHLINTRGCQLWR